MGSLVKRLGIIRHAIALGWTYPVWAVLTARRSVPIHRKITYTWADLLRRRFRVRVDGLEGDDLIVGQRCLYFFPHRSVSDFFLHKLITDGRGATLSRAGMGVIFPMTWLCTRGDRSTWFFNRRKRRGVKAFYAWLDEEFERCPLNGLIVYPEGHRNRGDTPLPLMGGLVNYAFSRQLPVQVISTYRTERVVDEKTWNYAYGMTVPYRIETPIDPTDYVSRKEFQKAIAEVFSRSFAEVTVADGRFGDGLGLGGDSS